MLKTSSRAAKKAARLAAGGVKKYEPDLEWKADRVVAVTRTRSTGAFNTRWSGYDHTFNTNEPRGNLRDAVLVRDFSSNMSAIVDVEHALHLLRDAMYRSACRMRRPSSAWRCPCHVPRSAASRTPSLPTLADRKSVV